MIMEATTPKDSLTPRDRLIVALDLATPDKNRALIDKLGDEVSFYKVGWRLFLSAGMPFLQDLRSSGKKVLLDLKMDAISEAIQSARSVVAGQAEIGLRHVVLIVVPVLMQAGATH